MSRILAIIVLIAVVIWALIYFDVIALTGEGEQAVDNVEDAAGEAASETGEAMQDAGEELSD